MNNASAGLLWGRASQNDFTAMLNRWHVARHAYGIVGNRQQGEALELARVLAEAQAGRPAAPEEKNLLQTVYRLARAYAAFLVLYTKDGQRARSYRRRYPYTRFETLANKMSEYEIDPDRLWDYLDIEGGNRAMGAFIDDQEHPLPEWARRAGRINTQAEKLVNDYDVPDRVRRAAKIYIAEFKKWQSQ